MKNYRKSFAYKQKEKAKWILLFFVFFISSFFIFSKNASADGWLAGWTYRKAITISNANVGTDLSDFPLYVKINADANIGDYTQNDGDDIRFTSSDGTTLLKYEEESWSGGAGTDTTASYWVKVPTLSHDSNTIIYIYYGNAGATDGQDAANVWNNTYKGVWHLSETGANPTAYDSTTNNNDSTAQTWTPTTGKLGGGASLNGTQKIKNAANNLPASNAAQTISIWAHYTSAPASVHNLVASVGNTNAVQLGFKNGPPVAWKNGGDPLASGTEAPSTSNWHQYTFTTDGTNHALYIDGVSAGTGNAALQAGNPNYIMFGSWEDAGGEAFVGQIDEARIKTGSDTAEWVEFEYCNEMSSASGNCAGNNEISFSSQETGIVSTPYAWVPNVISNNVSKINTDTNSTSTINVNTNPQGVAVDVSGYVWVANFNSNNVSKIDASTGEIAATINVGSHPQGVAIDSSGYVWVTNYSDGNVSKIDASNNSV